MQLKTTFDPGRIIFMQEILQKNGYFIAAHLLKVETTRRDFGHFSKAKMLLHETHIFTFFPYATLATEILKRTRK